MTRRRATLIGFSAVLMWALLALLTIGSAPVPPLQLNALCFGIGGLIGLAWTARRGFHLLLRTSWKVYAFGTAGLFGYHWLYFNAFREAPVAETGLIAYLWPLFIVLFSGLLPGERLRALHVVGALLALAGAALILLEQKATAGGSLLGYGLAFGCALVWSTYSVLSRRLKDAPTETVTVFCLATALLSAIAHFHVEETLWPADATGWAAVAALGIGPVGVAFFTWDIGMKQGDIQLLGVASYAAPLLSTLVLVAAGVSPPGWALLAATLLITGGAAIAARANSTPPRAPPAPET